MPNSPVTHVNGWIPYGAVDDSIIFQHSLTTPLVPADITNIAAVLSIGSTGLTWDAHGSVVHGHDVTHHPEFGMKAVSTVDNLTECGYYMQGGSTKLDNGGQISFEVEREWLTVLYIAMGSAGYNPPSSELLISATATTGGAQTFIRKTATTMTFYSNVNAAAITGYISSAGKSSFVRVCIGWSGGRVGGRVIIAVADGPDDNPVVISSGQQNSPAMVGLIQHLYLGSDRGNAGTFVTNHYMRNLQISRRPPMFSIHPLLRHVRLISDSMLASDDIVAGDYKDAVSSWTFRRELAKSGHNCGLVTTTVEDGARFDTSWDGGTIKYIKNQLTTLPALQPTVVIIRGGTNDANGGRCSQAGWQSVIAGYITDCMAVESVRRLIFLGIPSAVGYKSTNTATFKAQRTLGETIIKAAVAAWRVDNPTDTRDVIFVPEIYMLLGGEAPPPDTYVGQVTGLYTELHFSGYGHYLHGKAIANALIENL